MGSQLNFGDTKMSFVPGASGQTFELTKTQNSLGFSQSNIGKTLKMAGNPRRGSQKVSVSNKLDTVQERFGFNE
jgi:hypothetical protein